MEVALWLFATYIVSEMVSKLFLRALCTRRRLDAHDKSTNGGGDKGGITAKQRCEALPSVWPGGCLGYE